MLYNTFFSTVFSKTSPEKIFLCRRISFIANFNQLNYPVSAFFCNFVTITINIIRTHFFHNHIHLFLILKIRHI